MVVAKTSEDVRIVVTCQSNLEIAGSLRKLLKQSINPLFSRTVEHASRNFEGRGRKVNSQG